METLASLHCLGLLLLLPTGGSAFYSVMIKAGVLGIPTSNDAHLYTEIAEVLLKEAPDRPGERFYSKSYCRLIFEPLTFDMSNGDAVYDSLTYARETFEDPEVAVAIGPFIPIFSSTNYVITRQLHLLTSSVGMNADMMDSSRVRSVLPEPSSLSLAISAVIQRLGWTDLAFLAQDDFSPVLALGDDGVQVWPIRLPNFFGSFSGAELQRNLMSIRQSGKKKFILHTTSKQTVINVLSAAKQLHLLHHSIEWFVTYLDFYDIVDGDYAWPGILYGLQLLREDKLPSNLTHIVASNISRLDLGLAVDVVGILRHVLWHEGVDCSRERLVQDYVVPAKVFTYVLKNRDEGKAPYDGALGQYFWDKKTNLRTNFTIDLMRYEAENGTTRLGYIYFDNGKPNVTVGHVDSHYAEERGFFEENDVLRVATQAVDPFVIKKGKGYIGFSVDLLQALAKKCKFKYELIEVDNVMQPNGETINGMVKALLTGNASMAVGAIDVTAEREKIISFSYTILSSQASILIKKAESTTNYFQFLGPFSRELWFVILLFILVAAASLYVMSRYDPTQKGNDQQFDLKESLWYGFNIVLQGSTDYSPGTTAMRAIIAFFWFCVLVIEAAYTANLAAFLTLQQMDDRIKTVSDLAGQTKLMYGVDKNSEIMRFFQNQREDPYERMWAFMKVHEDDAILSNTTEILDKVKDGKMAFISDDVVNGYYANHYCGIESIVQNFGSKDFSLAFPRGVPYLDDINHALLELKEEGELDRLKDKWWAMGKNCTEEDTSRSVTHKSTPELELSNMIGVFIILGAFVVLAVFVDTLQRLMKRENNRKKEIEKKKKEETVELNAGNDHDVAETPDDPTK